MSKAIRETRLFCDVVMTPQRQHPPPRVYIVGLIGLIMQTEKIYGVVYKYTFILASNEKIYSVVHKYTFVLASNGISV